jgi:hypothetical protein
MSAVENCRSAALGGHVERCEDCGHHRIAYNSCRNRHCPKCQGAAAKDWLAAREFICVLSGEVVLVTGAGAEVLRPGDCAGSKAGDPDGHHLQNRSDADATALGAGTRHPGGDTGYGSDCDLIGLPAGTYARRDGTPYPEQPRRSG